MIADLKCPNCGGQAFTDYGDGLVACQRCSAQFDLEQQQCPHCGALLAEGTFVCLQCGTDRRGDLATRTIRQSLTTAQDRRRAWFSQGQQRQDKGEEEQGGLKCPHCGGTTFTDYGDGLIACQRCYTQFDLNQQQCPLCGFLLAEGVVICTRCGTDLRGEGAQRIIRERLMTTADWRRARLSQVQRVKAEAEEASQRRLEAWWEEDRKRREAERQQELARQRHRRNVLAIWGLIVVVIVLLIALIVLLVYSPTQPDPTPAAWVTQACVS